MSVWRKIREKVAIELHFYSFSEQIAEWVLLHAAICTYFRKRFSYISMEKLKEQFP